MPRNWISSSMERAERGQRGHNSKAGRGTRYSLYGTEQRQVSLSPLSLLSESQFLGTARLSPLLPLPWPSLPHPRPRPRNQSASSPLEWLARENQLLYRD